MAFDLDCRASLAMTNSPRHREALGGRGDPENMYLILP